MTKILAYTMPATGHVYPLVPGLLELASRGHDVHVRTSPDALDALRAVGLDVSSVDPRILDVEVTDYLAESGRERLTNGLRDLMNRGRLDGPDLARAIDEHRPDVLLVDSTAYGAITHAEASGLPWALMMPSLLPLKGKGIPPYGMGLAPLGGPIGAFRDAALWKVTERVFGAALLPGLNQLRRDAGLVPHRTPFDIYGTPDRVIVMTGPPLEYVRTDLPSTVSMVGSQPWDPPAAAPAYVEEPGDPWVLVTCSTDYQGDESLARAAVEALRDEPVRVLLTLADAYDTARLPSADNVRVERFVSHGPVLERAAAIVCHAGMGIVSKAVAAGVPIVAVPFGRDQPEVARRVVEAGAGVSIPATKLTAESLRSGLRDALTLRDGARAAAMSTRRSGGPGAFADAVLSLERNGHPVR
jgi:MGT family glycosyltransferase